MIRFEVESGITFQQFRIMISKKLKVGLKFLKLTREDKKLFKSSDDKKTLQKLGIVHGDLIILLPKCLDQEKIQKEKEQKKQEEEELKRKAEGTIIGPDLGITDEHNEEQIIELENEWDSKQEKELLMPILDRIKEGKIVLPYHLQVRMKNLGNNSLSMSVIDWLDETKPKISHQEKGDCIGVEFDFQSGNAFHSFVSNTNYEIPRVGYLFGTVNNDGSVTVDFIYEPPQKVLPKTQRVYILENEEEFKLMKGISKLLGLKPVGWVVAHKPKRSKRKLMKAWQIIQAARIQARFGEHAVTVIACPRKSGKAQFEAYQVSNQTVELVKQNKVKLSSRDYTLDFFERVIVEKKKEMSAGSYFFMITIPIIIHQSFLKNNFFIENRGPWNRGDLNVHLMTNKEKSWEEKFSDPHFLLFLAKMEIFSLKTDFPMLCTQIKNKEKITSGFSLMLEMFQN
ncbi:nuclear protein localization [Anaeramoeba flamelloides]|uniref:Nuclear protein localization n=1 Tax=Anaeramoeba flamelloides TaxID=1746091 RepID=A0AAV7ZNX4_9EUKA|nr:nuclear protein localization [Anaeramoeba flamelloides]